MTSPSPIEKDTSSTAWARPAAWEGEIPLGEGHSAAAPEIAAMIVKELAVHGWDVARSIGEDFALSDASAALVLAVVEEHGEIYRQYQGFAAPRGGPPPGRRARWG